MVSLMDVDSNSIAPLTMPITKKKLESAFAFAEGNKATYLSTLVNDAKGNYPNMDIADTGIKVCEEKLKNQQCAHHLSRLHETLDIGPLVELFLKKPKLNDSPIPIEEFGDLSNSFKIAYVGAASKALNQLIESNEFLFHNHVKGAFYAKLLSIVQSSGTGKTRAGTQLWTSGCIVVYVCLRSATDTKNFPRRDAGIADILTDFSQSGDEYELRSCRVFTALFKTVEDKLQNLPESTKANLTGLPRAWEQMYGVHGGVNRALFWGKFQEFYNQKASAPTSPDPKSPKNSRLEKAQRLLREAYDKLMQTRSKIWGRSTAPKIVFLFDEAHTMAGQEKEPSYYAPHRFCRVINHFSTNSSYGDFVWTIFASTSSKVSEFSAAAPYHNSARVAEGGKLLFRPFTLTGWDHHAPRDIAAACQFDMVDSFAQLSGFGRPLWRSLDYQGATGVFSVAREKLVHGFANESIDDQALALLSQRFALDVAFGHPEAVKFLDTAVASHMRICESVTEDRMWRFTSYPSEPILSCASTSQLHSGFHLVHSLEVLNRKILGGMIDKGRRGELISRILLLLAVDYTRIKHPRQSHLSTVRKMPFAHPIRLLDYLEVAFGLEAKDIGNAALVFEDAYINPTHWVSMSANIQPKASDSDSEDYKYVQQTYPGVLQTGTAYRLYVHSVTEFLKRLWIRTAAIQCTHAQPDIDKLIVIYFLNRGWSTMMISDKLKSTSSESKLDFSQPASIGLGTGLAYVTILTDMGVEPGKPKATFDNKMNCLRIYLPGTSSQAYPFIARVGSLEARIQDLTRDAVKPPANENVVELAKAFQFGKTSLPEYIHWETRQ